MAFLWPNKRLSDDYEEECCIYILFLFYFFIPCNLGWAYDDFFLTILKRLREEAVKEAGERELALLQLLRFWYAVAARQACGKT